MSIRQKFCPWMLSVTAAMLLGTVATADEPTPADQTAYRLEYGFKMGEVVRFNVEHRASVRSTIEGTTQDVLTHTRSVKAWKITDVLPNGDIEFVNMVEQVKMTNKLADRAEMVYDSTKDQQAPAGWEDVARTVGEPLSVIRMTPQGEIVDRQIKHAQPASDADAPVALRLPDEKVKIGDTWSEPRTVTIKTADGANRDIQTRRLYKLVKVANDVADIEVTYQVLTPIDPPIEAQLVQRLLKGVARFDLQTGRVLSQTYDVDKRILGFAGPTSTMHYLMRMEEKAVDKTEVATRPQK